MSPDKLLVDLFQAYYDARKNKRSTINALAFEINYESKLLELYKEIKNGTYKINRSVCFISFKPVQREIFAADFRDRIVHHLIYNYISPLFERLFINDSYSCRIGRGTSYGIKRLDHFIRSCSRNYSEDCYILKLDIKGYFMAIDHFLLYQKIEVVLNRFRKEASFDVDLILSLIRQSIFCDPTKDCLIKGKKENWDGLPRSKSLFFTDKNKGLPIGNLTSQLFGNVYLNSFDHFVKYALGCRYYGRYVDDIVMVHQDKEYLKSLIPILKEYLQKELFLELHPRKIYLQHFSKGVCFLGAVLKPCRIYIAAQTKGNFYKNIQYWNDFLAETPNEFNEKNLELFLSGVNSYLGNMDQFNTYKLRKKMLMQNLSSQFWSYFCVSGDYDKLAAKIRKS
jgi:hypothetical protein